MCFFDSCFERLQKIFANHAFRVISGTNVGSTLRLSVNGKVFQCRQNVRFVDERPVTLEAFHCGHADSRNQIGIFSVGFLGPTPAWVAGQIDNWGMYGPAHLTDSYAGGVKPNDSINMTPASGNPAETNLDSIGNWQTIRFRHRNNTLANALMVDGHVESFTYDPKKRPNDPLVTTMTRKNIYVNPAS